MLNVVTRVSDKLQTRRKKAKWRLEIEGPRAKSLTFVIAKGSNWVSVLSTKRENASSLRELGFTKFPSVRFSQRFSASGAA